MTVCAVCGLRIQRAEERDRPWLHDDPAYDPFAPPIHAPRPEPCDAKIRPFPNPTEARCERADGPHDEHRAVLRDYAYPGSETVLTWQETDRRTFRGTWRDCDLNPNCILPAGHRGRHEQ